MRGAHLRNHVWRPGESTDNVLEVRDRDMFCCVQTEAGGSEAEDIVEVVDERLPDIVRLGLEVGEPRELTKLDLRLVAPVV
jgi:hypothetical protein